MFEGKRLDFLCNANLEGGVLHGQYASQNFRFYKCYDICFYNFCEKHPLIWKNRF